MPVASGLPYIGYLTKLREILATHFSEDELRTLCFELGIDYDSLPGEGKVNKVSELVGHLDRRGRIPELVKIASALHPNVDFWNDTPEWTWPRGSKYVWKEELLLRGEEGAMSSEKPEKGDLPKKVEVEMEEHPAQKPPLGIRIIAIIAWLGVVAAVVDWVIYKWQTRGYPDYLIRDDLECVRSFLIAILVVAGADLWRLGKLGWRIMTTLSLIGFVGGAIFLLMTLLFTWGGDFPFELGLFATLVYLILLIVNLTIFRYLTSERTKAYFHTPTPKE